jgi:hypothetical protein
MTDKLKLPYGKYKGLDIKDVKDEKYLIWFWKKLWEAVNVFDKNEAPLYRKYPELYEIRLFIETNILKKYSSNQIWSEYNNKK